MTGTKRRVFSTLPPDVSLEELVPKDSLYRRLEAALDLRHRGYPEGRVYFGFAIAPRHTAAFLNALPRSVPCPIRLHRTALPR